MAYNKWLDDQSIGYWWVQFFVQKRKRIQTRNGLEQRMWVNTCQVTWWDVTKDSQTSLRPTLEKSQCLAPESPSFQKPTWLRDCRGKTLWLIQHLPTLCKRLINFGFKKSYLLESSLFGLVWSPNPSPRKDDRDHRMLPRSGGPTRSSWKDYGYAFSDTFVLLWELSGDRWHVWLQVPT